MPLIQFAAIDGWVCTTAVWPLGMPVSLPKVDHVLVGRTVGGEKRFGLAPWAEVVGVIAQNPRFDIETNPNDLKYFQTPPSIAEWVMNISLIDLSALEKLPPLRVFDVEIMKAAWESIEQGEIEGAITLTPPPRNIDFAGWLERSETHAALSDDFNLTAPPRSAETASPACRRRARPRKSSSLRARCR